jgi:hypothetical protein
MSTVQEGWNEEYASDKRSWWVNDEMNYNGIFQLKKYGVADLPKYFFLMMVN